MSNFGYAGRLTETILTLEQTRLEKRLQAGRETGFFDGRRFLGGHPTGSRAEDAREDRRCGQ